mmetsp:Transcript_78755/g.138980  ORF Transcript_78755/g.138980 Transcript_78755/m.138980 type:complete len:268 (-) Transcript_78755:2752-3555(-)
MITSTDVFSLAPNEPVLARTCIVWSLQLMIIAHGCMANVRMNCSQKVVVQQDLERLHSCLSNGDFLPPEAFLVISVHDLDILKLVPGTNDAVAVGLGQGLKINFFKSNPLPAQSSAVLSPPYSSLEFNSENITSLASYLPVLPVTEAIRTENLSIGPSLVTRVKPLVPVAVTENLEAALVLQEMHLCGVDTLGIRLLLHFLEEPVAVITDDVILVLKWPSAQGSHSIDTPGFAPFQASVLSADMKPYSVLVTRFAFHALVEVHKRHV